ncbi:hypothetical protein [Paenibacillus terrigena]|nr:hypothetical protein [Paenibacillus terrigena]
MIDVDTKKLPIDGLVMDGSQFKVNLKVLDTGNLRRLSLYGGNVGTR